ncbi:BYE1 [Candida pseudojiufengensis]|uniref:BYE1 n=1 Tax=Candida pseudojiufengensis TaxID=497109 RepID=UPI002224C8D3|nr:BYE1 [Candida pseudojiufengensis]KAI5958748.1 BYE1 [Candida pseudojiufengensis]
MPRVSARSNKGTHSLREREALEAQAELEQNQGYQKLNVNNKSLHTKNEPKPIEKDDDDEEFKPDQKDNDQENQGDDDNLEDENDIRCGPCGATTENYDEEDDPYGTMVFCEHCKTWQHLRCMGLNKKSNLDDYKCDICSGNPRPLLKKRKSSSVNEEPQLKKKTPGRKSQNDAELGPFERLKDPIRVSTAKAFYNFLNKISLTKKKIEENKSTETNPESTKISEEEINSKSLNIALELESIMNSKFTKKLYSDEGRRVLFILKKGYGQDLLNDKLTVLELMNKSPQDLNADIAKIEQQNKENIKNIVLVENDQTQIVRRTHKGEIILENENEFYNQMDESIAARKVDHRRFSQDLADLEPNHLKTDKVEKSIYNNVNPRLEHDDSSSDEEEEEEEKEEQQNEDSKDRENKATTTSEFNKSQHNPEEITIPTNETQDDQKSTESLSDNGNAPTPEEDKIQGFLNGELNSDDKRSPEPTKSKSPSVQIQAPPIELWQGSITFPELANFKANAFYYSSTDYINDTSSKSLDNSTNIARDIFKKQHSYIIEGRLQKETCEKYLNMITSTRNLYIIEIKPNNLNFGDENKISKNQRNFDKLYHYFIKSNKVGVLSGKPSFVKDSYLMSIDFRDLQLSKIFQNHKIKLSDKIGLFAVFVVSKNYKPQKIDELEDVRINYSRPSSLSTTSSNNYSNSKNSNNKNLESILNQL